MPRTIFEDNLQTVEMLQSMKPLWNWTRTKSPEQRGQFFAALANCSDELQDAVLRLVVIVQNPQSPSSERQRAMAAIADMLSLSFENDAEECTPNRSADEGTPAHRPAPEGGGRGFGSQGSAFAERLRALMQARGISQQDLAERIGCSQPAISQMLGRNRRPQKATILRLAEALRVSPRELWPDLDAAAMLDAVASFQQNEYPMTEVEAEALAKTAHRNPPRVPARALPQRRR
jgi:transcriptional regulator with XRE-family HTH domain